MSGAITAAVVIAGAGLVAANQQRQAAKGAAGAQQAAAQAGISEQRSQFEALQRTLGPYTQAGIGAIGGQEAILGLRGPEAQRAAIAAIEGGPQFGALLKQGENAMLQNASATGGLRGGNLQAAMAQFRPQLLSQLIDQQYGRLGGLTQIGQASAAGVGAAGMQTGRDIAGLLGTVGQAQAGGILGQGAANAASVNAIGRGIGMFFGGAAGQTPGRGF